MLHGDLVCNGGKQQPPWARTQPVTLRDLQDNFLAAIHVPDLNAGPSLGSRQGAPVHSGQGSHPPGHQVHLYRAAE